ncbi:hypothetical protein [Mesoplasma melaleucae]|uniref:Uncharacterized protein n=1 Tax=Mesoplasma melaleucae TaxID=81459 RepID=A0A2K8NWA1_9MOLU|nr:hypothetical protein [Mesoplasma melaleucae]ATZ18125.1 hypothetical protein EMELA_v1c06120 [Mesoplasma melaleucae]
MGEPRSTYLNNWLKLFLQKDKFKNEMNFLCITLNYQNSSGVKFIFWENGGWRDTYIARINISKIQVTVPNEVL